MNAIEILSYASGIGLIESPLLQHGRPCSRRAYRVDSDLILCVVGRHRLGERDHSAIAGNVGCVILLSQESDHARRIQNRTRAFHQGGKGKLRRPVNGFQVCALQFVPLFFGRLVQRTRWSYDSCIVVYRVQSSELLQYSCNRSLDLCSVRNIGVIRVTPIAYFVRCRPELLRNCDPGSRSYAPSRA